MKRLLQISTLFIAMLIMISCGDDGTGPEPPPEPTTGAVQVTTNTTGKDKDGDGYTVTAAGQSTDIPASGTAMLANLSEGDTDAKLSGLAANCAVSAGNPQTVSITAGDTTSASFDVKCAAVADGQIAFTSERDGGDEDIFLMNPDGSGLNKLTSNKADDENPAVSHDGTKIAFVSDRGSTVALYVMAADGSGVTKLASPVASGLSQQISWSPDDSTLAFIDLSGNKGEVYTMRLTASVKKHLTHNSIIDQDTDWSPDGSKIIYASKADGDFEIYTMNPDGSDSQQLTKNSKTDVQPRWSPDGSKIAFISDRDGNNEIHIMDPDGTDIKQVTKSQSAYNKYPSWSPDGSVLTFFTNRDGNDEVYKINADGSGTATNLTDDDFPHWSPVE